MHRITWVLGIVLGAVVAALTVTTALAEEEPPVVGDGGTAAAAADAVGGASGAAGRATDDRVGLRDLIDLGSLAGVALGEGGTSGRGGAPPALDARLGLRVGTLAALEPGVQDLVSIGREVGNLRGVSVGELIGFAQTGEDFFDLGDLGALRGRLDLDNLVRLGTPPAPVAPAQTPQTPNQPIELSDRPELGDVVDLRDVVGADDTVVSSEPIVTESPVDVTTGSAATGEPVDAEAESATPIAPVESRVVTADGQVEPGNVLSGRGVGGELVDVANLVTLTQPATVQTTADSPSPEATDSTDLAEGGQLAGTPESTDATQPEPVLAGDFLGLRPRLGAVAGTTSALAAAPTGDRLRLGDLVDLRAVVSPAPEPVEGARIDPNGGSDALVLSDGSSPPGPGVVDLNALLDDGDGHSAGETDAGDLLLGGDGGGGTPRRLVLTQFLALADTAPAAR